MQPHKIVDQSTIHAFVVAQGGGCSLQAITIAFKNVAKAPALRALLAGCPNLQTSTRASGGRPMTWVSTRTTPTQAPATIQTPAPPAGTVWKPKPAAPISWVQRRRDLR